MTRIALVGCGAVTQEYYVPALKLLPEHSVDWFVDSNAEIAKQAAKAYGQGKVERDYKEVIGKIDAAIVAVPNYLHSKISVDLLESGCDVLCEKPLAMNVEQAKQMIRASQSSGARLAVNHMRRRFDSFRMAKDIVRQDLIGAVGRVVYEEGNVLSWPVASSFILDKSRAGGGALIDWGPHALDILRWIFDGELEVVSYKDDSLGRIEANCEAILNIRRRHDVVPCTLRLSRSRKLANSLVIEGNKARMEIRLYELNCVYLALANHTLKLEQVGKPTSDVGYFAEQVTAFLDKSSNDVVGGSEALEYLQVIEKCYRDRQNLVYPWDVQHQDDLSIDPHHRILVAGASGFLGSRLVEKLALNSNAKVRVTVHRPQTAVRLARLPIEFADCDILDQEQVMRCVRDCDVVVNCARDTSGDSKSTLNVFTIGTRNLLEASTKNNVRKFIHISSAAVHGFRHAGQYVDESARFKQSRNSYVRGKIESERLVMSYAKRLGVVILRPTLIYGPYSSDWVTAIVNRLENKQVTLVGEDKIANLVYVDDVVDAILLAIGKDEGNGKVFFVNNDRDVPHWKDYIQRLCDLLSVNPVMLPSVNRFVLRLRTTVNLMKDSIHLTRKVMRSAEMIALLAQIPLVVLVGAKLIKGEKRRKIEAEFSSPLYLPIPDPRTILKYLILDGGLSEVFACTSVFSAARARNIFGFEPQTTFAEGMEKTIEWVKWALLGQSLQE